MQVASQVNPRLKKKYEKFSAISHLGIKPKKKKNEISARKIKPHAHVYSTSIHNRKNRERKERESCGEPGINQLSVQLNSVL